MNYLLIRHKVADFAKWKAAFDAHQSARTAAGIRTRFLFRNLDNHNEVVLIFEDDYAGPSRGVFKPFVQATISLIRVGTLLLSCSMRRLFGRAQQAERPVPLCGRDLGRPCE